MQEGEDLGVFFNRFPGSTGDDVLSNIKNCLNRQLEVSLNNILQIVVREKRVHLGLDAEAFEFPQVPFE